VNAKILIVDDETDLLEVLSMNLQQQGYITRTAQTGAEALSKIRTDRPDLILLDIMLDDVSGIKLTGKLKNTAETADIPIILLTAKDSDTDIVVGLSVGADDYVTKPFKTEVLAARIEAVLRLAKPQGSKIGEILSAGPIKVIPANHEVIIKGKSIDLTGAEYNILVALIKAGGGVLSRDDIKAILDSDASDERIRIVDVHIAALRKKLGAYRDLIKTVHGRGYRITS